MVRRCRLRARPHPPAALPRITGRRPPCPGRTHPGRRHMTRPGPALTIRGRRIPGHRTPGHHPTRGSHPPDPLLLSPHLRGGPGPRLGRRTPLRGPSPHRPGHRRDHLRPRRPVPAASDTGPPPSLPGSRSHRARIRAPRDRPTRGIPVPGPPTPGGPTRDHRCHPPGRPRRAQVPGCHIPGPRSRERPLEFPTAGHRPLVRCLLGTPTRGHRTRGRRRPCPEERRPVLVDRLLPHPGDRDRRWFRDRWSGRPGWGRRRLHRGHPGRWRHPVHPDRYRPLGHRASRRRPRRPPRQVPLPLIHHCHRTTPCRPPSL